MKSEMTQTKCRGTESAFGPIGCWGSKLTRALYQYGQDMWQVRNLSIHGSEDELSLLERRQRAQQRIRNCMKTRDVNIYIYPTAGAGYL